VTPERRLRLLSTIANVTLVYPFFVVGSLYGCWLLACRILGHEPIAWIDDPAETLSAGGVFWLYVAVTWLAVVGIIPVFFTSIAGNIAHIAKSRPSAVQAGIRLLTVASVWVWFWCWLANDRHEIMKWWMD